jgi:hypothetical protein
MKLAFVISCDRLNLLLRITPNVEVVATVVLLRRLLVKDSSIVSLMDHLFVLQTKELEVWSSIDDILVPILLFNERGCVEHSDYRLCDEVESTFDWPPPKTSDSFRHAVTASSEPFGLGSDIWIV